MDFFGLTSHVPRERKHWIGKGFQKGRYQAVFSKLPEYIVCLPKEVKYLYLFPQYQEFKRQNRGRKEEERVMLQVLLNYIRQHPSPVAMVKQPGEVVAHQDPERYCFCLLRQEEAVQHQTSVFGFSVLTLKGIYVIEQVRQMPQHAPRTIYLKWHG